MTRRFAVLLSIRSPRDGSTTDHIVATRRTLVGALRAADTAAQRNRSQLGWTMAGSRARAYVSVERDGCPVYEHPGFRVPSVGELGYW